VRDRWKLWCLGLAALVLAIDQFYKWWMLNVYMIADKSPVTISPFLDLVMVWNRGISYGLFQQNSETGRIILILLSGLAIILIMVWMMRSGSRFVSAALALVAGGATGNVVDRLNFGAVADFFALHAFGYNWYVFNLADTAIVAGVAGLIYDSLFIRHKSAAKDQ
jgi:signal peptidase II